jgi:hypothetical protein
MLLRISLWCGVLTFPVTAAAQHDYRNLDRGRPLSTEDAYPVEAGALEVMMPWSFEREAGASGLVFEPEVMWGIFRNAMVGLGAPIRLGDAGGLSGLRPFAFYNVNSEGYFPAFALRLDASIPVGALGGTRAIGELALILTKSFGTTRVHFNQTMSIGSANGPLVDHPVERSSSFGMDHTLWRRSTVLMAEIQRNKDGYQSWWIAGVGIRRQVTPVMVLDVGLRRQVSPRDRPDDLVLTAGLTRSLATRGGVE